MSDAINLAAEIISGMRNINAEIVQKKFPAEGIIYARLYTDDGREEWTLLDPDSDYDKAFAMMMRSANRLREDDDRGV